MSMQRKSMALVILIGLLCVCCVCPAFSDETQPKAAPVSPEFLKWQEEQDNGDKYPDSDNPDTGSIHSFPTGYQPDPLDISHLSENPPDQYSDSTHPMDGNIPIPTKYDLRDESRVPEIRNQGAYATCWSFAATAACESNYLSQKLSFLNGTPDLSELHMAWFVYKDPEPGNSFYVKSNASFGKGVLGQGGNSSKSTAYLARLAGSVNESSLPYTKAASMTGDEKPEDYYPVVLRLKEALTLGNIDSNNRETMLPLVKEMIMKHGAVNISYYAGDGAYSGDGTSTAAYFDNSQGTYTDHAVTVIGWDDNYSRENFSASMRPVNDGAWLVRNSWGTNWGNYGYFYMSYEQYIGRAVVFIAGENEKGIKHYGHDALGHITSFSNKWAANVFKAERDNEGIKEIGFYTTDNNAEYDLYIFDLGTEQPSKPVPSDTTTEPLYSLKGSKAAYTGYHTAALPTVIPVEKGHYFSVVLRMITSYAYPTAIETEYTNYAYPEINEKESWFSGTNSDSPYVLNWKDGKNGIIYNGDTEPTPMNACIKAFTVLVPDEEPDPEGIEINSANFPDNVFREYVSTNFDKNNNGWLSDAEIDAVKRIQPSDKSITSLKGIEFFTKITYLSFQELPITELDISKNTALTDIWGGHNQLTELDTSKNTSLLYLQCVANKITKLDVSKNVLLRYLNCWENELTELDLSKNTELQTLYCEFNKITALDVSKNTKLSTIKCEDNKLTHIDISKNTELDYFNCSGNPITGELDVSKNTKLTYLGCSRTQIDKLDVTNNTELIYLYSAVTNILQLDVSKNVKLKELSCSDNKMTALDVSKNTALTDLWCSNNYLTAIDLSNNNKLSYSSVYGQTSKTLLVFRQSDGTYQVNFSKYVPDFARVSNVKDSNGNSAAYSTSTGIASFTTKPSKVTYSYDTGSSTSSRYMTVTLTEDEKPVILTSSLPDASTGTAYSVILEASGSAPVTWSILSGSLPSGLSLNPSTGKISGTAESSGTFNFTVKAVNSYSYDTKALTLTVKNAGTAPVITTSSKLPAALTGQSYSVILEALGTEPVTWTKTSGTLPNGLSLSSSGEISGTPSKYGKYSFTVKASNSIGESDPVTFTITVLEIPYDFVNGVVGDKYSDYVEVKGGTIPYSWMLSSSSVLPDGIGLSTKTSGRYAYLTGKPSKAGKFSFTLKVTDNDGETVTKTFTAVMKAKMTTKPAQIPDGTLGKSYSAALTVTGGLPQFVSSSKYKWSKSGGTLPDGLNLTYSASSSNKAVISGTPAKAAKFTFTVKVEDEDGHEITKQYSINIRNPMEIVNDFTFGRLNTAYNDYVEVRGGIQPYTWTLSKGKLPDGITLSTKTSGRYAYLKGKPTKAGNFTFTLKAVDKNKNPIEKQFTISVLNITGTMPVGTVGTQYNASLKVQGGYSKYTWKVSSGKIPAGLSLTYSSTGDTANLTGKPTKAGKYTFTMRAADKNKAYFEKSYAVTVVNPPEISGTFSNTTVGASYNDFVEAKNGTSGYTWVKASGKFPDGLKPVNYNGAKFTLKGKPTKAGTYTFTVKLTDKNGVSVSKKFTVTVAAKLLIPAKNNDFEDGAAGEAYDDHINASGGTAAYKWVKASGTLPAGLKLSYSGTEARLTGTPTKAGKFNFSLKITDSAGISATRSFTITINPIRIADTFKNGTAGKKYSDYVTLYGGTAPYTCKKADGNLPAGLSLSVSGKYIYLKGTPSKARTYTFTLKVTDANKKTGMQEFTIKINAAKNALPTERTESETLSSFEIRNSLPARNNASAEILTDNDIYVPESANDSVLPDEGTNSSESDSGHITSTSLKVFDDDVLESGTEKYSDLVTVRAGQPLTFIIGEWVSPDGSKVKVSGMTVYVDEKAYEAEISEEGIFTLPAEVVHDDFKVSVRADYDGVELETEELYISAQ